jgi:hypothetical protein
MTLLLSDSYEIGYLSAALFICQRALAPRGCTLGISNHLSNTKGGFATAFKF